MKFKVISVNISARKGVEKKEVPAIECSEGFGIINDAHAGNWHRQISLLAVEAVQNMQQQILDKGSQIRLKSGSFGENIVTEGIDWTQVEIGQKVKIDSVILEITQIGKECHSGCTISKVVGDCIMPRLGVFAKVLKGGTIHAGNNGHYCI